MGRFESEMGNLMNRFFGSRDEWLDQDVFNPRVNLTETDTDFEATVELPGMKAEDFHVEMEGGELRILGEKKEEKEEKGKTFHRVERHYGEFRRTIPLPAAVDPGKVTAEYKDGVLTVKVPKTEAAKPKKIEIKS
jgi:HSP20 family protein